MTRILHRNRLPSKSLRGFSLIEVMVAVVILATGLLALAALQGTLARNSADAKARSAIMAAMTSRMAVIRKAPPTAGETWTMSTDWVIQAAAQAGTSELTVKETIAAWGWKAADTNFESGFVSSTADFTRATLTATWSAPNAPCPNPDATTCKRLVLASDFSGNIYGLGGGYPGNDPLGSASKYPIVRQGNPAAIPGVIPIASGNQATAASNPQPILEGQRTGQVVGTSFDVLTYIPESDSTARIQKRFETQVIKCRCQFESGQVSAVNLGVAGKAQWPTIWNGDTYVVADVSGSAPGVAAKGIENPTYSGRAGGGSTRGQSEQCTECCRDRHDTATSAVKYDPVAPTALLETKYDIGTTGLVLTSTTPNKTYVESCRIVRTGGLWRTTADMYALQFGLLETKPGPLSTTNPTIVQAKDGTPNVTAVSGYTSFVKSYLGNYDGSAATPPLPGAKSAQDIFLLLALRGPKVSIPEPSVLDERYLHARGLFVDYLEKDARDAIDIAKKACLAQSKPAAECILPALPFTTINLTELANWTPTKDEVLSVNSGSLLKFNVTQPFGGRTRGIGAGEANNQSELRKSNSGVAASDDIPGATDLNGDQLNFLDEQLFEVLAGASGEVKDRFFVNIPSASAVTSVSYKVSTSSDSGGCFGNRRTPTKYDCVTASVMPQNMDITVSTYNREQTLRESVTATCTIIRTATTRLATATVDKPVLQNYSVSGVTGGTSRVINAAVRDNFADERTVIRVNGVLKDSTIEVTLSLFATRNDATVGTCTTNSAGTTMTVTSWNKPWN